jgi:predicted nucleotidyltransferase
VECEPGHEPGLLGLAAMENELATMLGGKKVDFRTPQDLSRHFRDQVLRAAEVQYALAEEQEQAPTFPPPESK